MGQRKLDDYTIHRINQLAHDQKLRQSVIVLRLGISRNAVKRNLIPLAQWQALKAK